MTSPCTFRRDDHDWRTAIQALDSQRINLIAELNPILTWESLVIIEAMFDMVRLLSFGQCNL